MQNNSISTVDVWLAFLQREEIVSILLSRWCDLKWNGFRYGLWFVGVPEMHLEKIGNFNLCIPRRLGYYDAITC